jgi:hypothetical protein
MGTVQEMYELYQGGATLQEVGEEFGVSHSRVGKLFKSAGLKTRPGGRRASDYSVEGMYALYEQGDTGSGRRTVRDLRQPCG